MQQFGKVGKSSVFDFDEGILLETTYAVVFVFVLPLFAVWIIAAFLTFGLWEICRS